MPESFNDRMPTPSASPKPARLGGSQGAITDSPSAKGAPGGGTDSTRVTRRDLSAPDGRAKTSSLKKTGAAVATFADDVT